MLPVLKKGTGNTFWRDLRASRPSGRDGKHGSSVLQRHAWSRAEGFLLSLPEALLQPRRSAFTATAAVKGSGRWSSALGGIPGRAGNPASACGGSLRLRLRRCREALIRTDGPGNAAKRARSCQRCNGRNRKAGKAGPFVHNPQGAKRCALRFACRDG